MIKTLLKFFRVHFGLWYLSAGFVFGVFALVFAMAAIGLFSLESLNLCLVCLIACAFEFGTAYFLMKDQIEKNFAYVASHCMVALLTFGLMFGWIVS